MTETKTGSTGSLGSEDSLVLIESADLPPATEVPAELAETGSQRPSAYESFAHDSEEEEEHEGTPPVAADVQVVDKIPSSDSFSSSVEENSIADDDEKIEVSEEHKFGAGIAIGIVTAPFVGPVFAVFAGVAAAYGTTQPGVAGDACRAAGDIAMVAKEKAIEVDQKHEIVKKTKDNANQLWDQARDQNDRHQIVENMRKMMACTLKNVADALHFAAEKMRESRKNKDTDDASYEKVSLEVPEN